MHAELKLKPLNISSSIVILTILIRLEPFKNLEKFNSNFLTLSAKNQTFTLLGGSQTYNSKSLNQEILKNVILYFKAPTRFDRQLLNF